MEMAVIGISAFLLGIIFVPIAMKVAFKFGIVDRPSTKLKKHEKPMPYLGGVAIYLAFVIPVIVAKIILHETMHGLIGILVGASIIMIMGLIDDLKNLNPYIKLAVQLFVALIIINVNMSINIMDYKLLNSILTVVWIVGITNALNLIDIMDGLASGVVAVVSLAFFIVAMMAGNVNDMIPAIALFGAVSAFFLFNRAPAKLYMGDAGSLLLGFLVAVLALNESYSRVNYVAVLSPILILGVPIFDTFLVMFIRIEKGILPIYGSDDHLVQRLVMIGLTKNKAVLFMILLTFILSALAILSTFMTTMVALIMYLGIAFGAMLFAMLVISVDMKNYHKVVRRKK